MTTMYDLPRINDSVTIERPICMYEMKNINGDDGSNEKYTAIDSKITGHVVNSLKVALVEVAALETRQEKILGQLEELKQQILDICDVLKDNNQSKSVITVTATHSQIPIKENLVVNVNPSRPCYSILALRKLWKHIDFILSPFTHSSISSKKIDGFEKTQSTGKSSVINLSLIWKEVTDVEVIVGGIHGYVIIGESNFLRYLVRTFSNEHYENSKLPSAAIQIDRILDLSHQLICQETSKHKSTFLSSLNNKLGSDKWFSGKNEPGISDVAVWSAIKQSSISQLPANLMKWYEKSENLFLK